MVEKTIKKVYSLNHNIIITTIFEYQTLFYGLRELVRNQ